MKNHKRGLECLPTRFLYFETFTEPANPWPEVAKKA
jgi:hypothetical protein